MKPVFLSFILLLLSSLSPLAAQDIITKANGEDIAAKVLEVGATDIKYKKFDNPDGPTFVIPKTDLLMIRYQNGTKDMFSEKTSEEKKDNTTQILKPTEKQAKKEKKPDYISFAPVLSTPILSFAQGSLAGDEAGDALSGYGLMFDFGGYFTQQFGVATSFVYTQYTLDKQNIENATEALLDPSTVVKINNIGVYRAFGIFPYFFYDTSTNKTFVRIFGGGGFGRVLFPSITASIYSNGVFLDKIKTDSETSPWTSGGLIGIEYHINTGKNVSTYLGTSFFSMFSSFDNNFMPVVAINSKIGLTIHFN